MRVSVTLLQYDHGLINQVIDVLGALAKRRNADKHLGMAKDIVAFLRRFADSNHHAKEETFLFPAGVQVGAIREDERQALVADHERARKLIAEMSMHLEKNELDDFYANATEFQIMMTAHIRKEEDDIFPRIEEKLELDVDDRLNRMIMDFMSANFPIDFLEASETFANKAQDEIMGPGYFERPH